MSFSTKYRWWFSGHLHVWTLLFRQIRTVSCAQSIVIHLYYRDSSKSSVGLLPLGQIWKHTLFNSQLRMKASWRLVLKAYRLSGASNRIIVMWVSSYYPDRLRLFTLPTQYRNIYEKNKWKKNSRCSGSPRCSVSESKETKDNGTEDIATDNKIWCHEQGDGENRIHVEELVIIHILWLLLVKVSNSPGSSRNHPQISHPRSNRKSTIQSNMVNLLCWFLYLVHWRYIYTKNIDIHKVKNSQDPDHGSCEFQQGGTNVVPSACTLSIDANYRKRSDAKLNAAYGSACVIGTKYRSIKTCKISGKDRIDPSPGPLISIFLDAYPSSTL